MKYRKKPVEIEALQWTGQNHREMFNFLGGEDTEYMTASGVNFYIDFNKIEGGLVIKTLEGEHIATIGDYIIKGIKGEYYPCKEDVFNLTYDKSDIELKEKMIEWDYFGWKKQIDVNQKDWNQTLITRLNQANAEYHRTEANIGSTTITVNDKIYSLLNTLEYVVDDMITHRKIVIDNNLDDETIIVGNPDFPEIIIKIKLINYE